jgi:tetratricopeptide (TPR) repeat protein
MPRRSHRRTASTFFAVIVSLTALTLPAHAEKAKAKGSGRAVELFNAGVKLQNQGQMDEAIEKYTEAIAAWPDDFQALANRGGLYRIKGIELRESSVGLEPAPKAEAATKTEDFLNRALADYAAAIKVSPKSDFLFHDRAAVYVALGKFDLAIADYDEFVKRKPAEARAYNDRGTALTELARAEKASEKSADAGNKKAMPEFQRAVADFTKAIELDPKLALAYINRGACNWQLLKVDEALADYGKAIEINPDAWRAYRSRAEIYKALGEDSKRSGDNAKAAEFAALQKADSAKYLELQMKPPATPTPAPAPAPKKK